MAEVGSMVDIHIQIPHHILKVLDDWRVTQDTRPSRRQLFTEMAKEWIARHIASPETKEDQKEAERRAKIEELKRQIAALEQTV